jgi:hypothetical protein
MKKAISTAICLKNIVIWALIDTACLLALGTFVRLYLESLAKGEEIFLPGVGALFAAVTLFFIYGATRVVKHVRLLKAVRK